MTDADRSKRKRTTLAEKYSQDLCYNVVIAGFGV